ncbi:CTP synthase [Candidatus Woesearchaeota archaeon CG1_02_57_44]|nr:MAG: CTP synthase [Candidatus Woesearchaeota archaeon CG1_02_57_44]
MSGLGKGIFSSALAKLMQDGGLVVAPVKFDGYLNVDAGTLNPYRHGEVFVLDDGTESDMDLGTYERFLDCPLSKENYLTGGKLFSMILNRERKGKYLGRDVQFIPHVTGEIKRFMRELAMLRNADLVFIEVGGTAGDIENAYFIEAMRELAYEEGPGNVCNVALTYLLEPQFLGEQKSKAAQLGIKALLGMGIQPHIIACRSTNPATEKVREKISVFSNVPMERVVGVHDMDSVYLIPDLLEQAGLHRRVAEFLGFTVKDNPIARAQWHEFMASLLHPKKKITIGMTGKYTGLRDSYASILKSLEHAGVASGCSVNIKWIETTAIKDDQAAAEALKDVDGIIVPGGFGKRGSEGKIACIQYAREHNIPYLGLCFGFQMAVLEYARHVCGISKAGSTELDTDCEPVIDILPEQKKIEGLGGNMRLGGRDVEIKSGTKAHAIYGASHVRERFRHRYEVNPDYIAQLEKAGMVFSGKHPEHPIMQILELPKHPFFVGVQFHPEFTSRPLRPNPLYKAFVAAASSPDRRA